MYKLAIQSDILRIDWPSIVLGFISKSLACTQQKYFTHIGSKTTGLKWASQTTTQIGKIIYVQWIHLSKLKHAVEVLNDNTK